MASATFLSFGCIMNRLLLCKQGEAVLCWYTNGWKASAAPARGLHPARSTPRSWCCSSQPHPHADCIRFCGLCILDLAALSRTRTRIASHHRIQAAADRRALSRTRTRIASKASFISVTLSGSQPHPHADCIGNMQQSGLCIRTLCIQFIPYRVYPAEQWRSYRRTDLDFGV